MFGNDDDKDQANTNDNGAPMPPSEPVADGTLSTDGASTTVVSPSNGSPIGDPTPPPDTPLINGEAPEADNEESPSDLPAPANDEADTVTDENESPTSPNAASDDLLSIKQDALQELGPLVDHLDQSPEEKFRTTMMMIQANDDQSLVKDAYETAKKISDEKTRAQALLDVINEINYFTQQKES